MKEVKPGDIVFIKTINNAARYGTEIIEAEVTKVGRKYYYVKWKNSFGDVKIDMEMLCEKSQYSPNYKMYFSESEITDENEWDKLNKMIRRTFEWHQDNKSLECLRKIKQVLDEELGEGKWGNIMEWISIKDKMPLEDDYVLLLDIYGSMTVGSWYLEEPNVYKESYFTPYPVFIDTNATSLENIEYWMPLPALPNGDSNA